MDTTQPRSRGLQTGGPLSPTLTDYLIQSQGGTTTAFDTMPTEVQMNKPLISPEERILELTRENGRLRQDIAYYKSLVKEVLYPVMALVRFHVKGLDSAVRKFNAKIEEANMQWQYDRI